MDKTTKLICKALSEIMNNQMNIMKHLHMIDEDDYWNFRYCNEFFSQLCEAGIGYDEDDCE